MVGGVKIRGMFWILSDFRELCFCTPCGPCYKEENLRWRVYKFYICILYSDEQFSEGDVPPKSNKNVVE